MMKQPLVRIVNDHVLFPDDFYDTPAAEACFVRKVVDELLPIAEHYHANLNARRFSITELSAVVRESVDALSLLWAGLSPEHQVEFEKKLIGLGWLDISAKHQRSVQRAQEMLAQRRAQ
jgi:hypothetical protein